MAKESKKDRQYAKMFSGKKHSSSAWNKAMVQNTMHEVAKSSALKKKTK